MLTTEQIATKLIEIIDKHNLWDEVKQYSGRDWAFLEQVVKTGVMGTTDLAFICFGAAIHWGDLNDGKDVEPAPTAWERNLNRHGVQYNLSYPNKDKPDAPLTIENVKLEMPPEDWCAMCMREGDHYIGPCCGTSGAMQDIVNGVFRDGGWISANDLRELSELGISHDGKDSDFLDTTLLARWSSRTEALTPWERIGCLWQLVDGHLNANWTKDVPYRKREDRPPETMALNALYGLVSARQFAGLFQHADDVDTEVKEQRRAVYLLDQAKFLTAVKSLYDHYTALKLDPFDGFAVRCIDTGEVAVNGYGACIYRTKEKADSMPEFWASNSRNYIPGNHEVLPCRVTMENGLEWK